MEPTIYKTGAYNTPGIYKGAGGIYKGRGVYKNIDDDFINVTIGDFVYKAQKINNRIWTVENFKQNTPLSVWYNDTPNSYGKLYNWEDFTNITPLLSDGWRIPSISDANDLITSNYLDLLSQINGGTNNSGFDFVLSGYRFANGSYYDFGVEGDFLLNQTGYRVRFAGSSDIRAYDYHSEYRFSMRFCKDI